MQFYWPVSNVFISLVLYFDTCSRSCPSFVWGSCLSQKCVMRIFKDSLSLFFLFFVFCSYNCVTCFCSTCHRVFSKLSWNIPAETSEHCLSESLCYSQRAELQLHLHFMFLFVSSFFISGFWFFFSAVPGIDSPPAPQFFTKLFWLSFSYIKKKRKPWVCELYLILTVQRTLSLNFTPYIYRIEKFISWSFFQHFLS